MGSEPEKTAVDCGDINIMVTDKHNHVITLYGLLPRLFCRTSRDIRKDIPRFHPDCVMGDDATASGAER